MLKRTNYRYDSVDIESLLLLLLASFTHFRLCLLYFELKKYISIFIWGLMCTVSDTEVPIRRCLKSFYFHIFKTIVVVLFLLLKESVYTVNKRSSLFNFWLLILFRHYCYW